MKMMVIQIVIGAFRTILKGLVKGTRRLRNKSTSSDHPDDNIVKIGQNTEKIPGDLRCLAISQTPVKNQQLTQERKTLEGVN